MKRRFNALITALVAVLAGAVLVAAPPASAASLSSPSTTHNIGCGGAWVNIDVEWKSDQMASFAWTLKDTAVDQKSPILKIVAKGPSGSTSYIFRNDQAYFVLDGGGGSETGGSTFDWNPGGLASLNHLWVEVTNGTTDQDTNCRQAKNIYNWTRIAFDNALAKQGATYWLDHEGPTYYDCSGLVYASYNPIANFPGWPVRSSMAMWNWAKDNTTPAKFYAKSVSWSELKIGDLLFYKTTSADVGHVAFYGGSGRLYDGHADGVPIGYHDETQWWKDRRVDAFRILGIAIA